MQESWEEYNNMVTTEVVDSVIKSNLLQAYLTSSLICNEISFESEFKVIQHHILKKYDVKPSLKQIEEELFKVKFDLENPILEIEEDFFNGY